MFWEKSRVAESLFVTEVANLKSKITNLELEIEKLKSHVMSLRGLVNRKMGGGFEEEKPQKESSVLLDPNGNPV